MSSGNLTKQIVEHGGDNAFAVVDVNVLEIVRRVAKLFFDGCESAPGESSGCREKYKHCASVTIGANGASAHSSVAPSGTLAMRRRASFKSAPRRWRMRASMSGWRTTLTPKPWAMPSMVTSSWVGPMPPEVKTKSKRWENSATSLPISGISSWIVEIFCTSTPKLAQFGAEKMRVDVLGLARQDLVADDDDASGFRHGFCLLPQRGQRAPEVRAATPSKIEFAAAHEEIALRVGADIFAFLID